MGGEHGRASRRMVLGGGAAIGGLAAGGLGAARAQGLAPPDPEGAQMRQRWAAQGVGVDRNGVMRLSLALRYRTDPERIRPFLFAPLELDPSAEVQINYFSILRPAGFTTVSSPGPTYVESDLMVSCLYQGKRAMTTLPWVLNSDAGRYLGREGVMLRKKDGDVRMDLIDGVLHAETIRQGRTMLRISAPLTEAPAHPYFWFREVGWGEMRLDFRLNVNWRESLFDNGPVELWRHFGADDGYPTAMGPASDHSRYPRALDLARTRLDLGDPSPLDPYAELPVLELLGGAGSITPALFPSLAVPRGPNKVPGRRGRTEPDERERIGVVDKAAVAPVAFVHKAYDPPIYQGEAWSPPGWPRSGSALRLPQEQLERYAAREALVIGPADLIDVRLALDPALHARAVPPPFMVGANPSLRILAQKVALSDVSTRPFTDIWLLLACAFEGRPVWFALSQVTSGDGDVINGRELFGYPAKLGEPDIRLDAARVEVRGVRALRPFLNLSIALSGPAAPVAEAFSVIGVQPQPKDRRPQALWIENPWRLEIANAQTLAPAAVRLALPDAEGPGLVGRTDPWFEFASAQVASARVGRGLVRRMPARVLGPVAPAAAAYLRDRMDGGAWPANKPNATFVAG